jgi:hypothetical protein
MIAERGFRPALPRGEEQRRGEAKGLDARAPCAPRSAVPCFGLHDVRGKVHARFPFLAGLGLLPAAERLRVLPRPVGIERRESCRRTAPARTRPGRRDIRR